MSKLERLIQQYCPDGVEYVKLDSVCSVMRGKRLTKSQLTSDGKYKVFHGGIEPIGFYDEWNREGNTTMVINVGASAGTIGYSSEKFWSSDGCFCLSQSNLISGKFLFYYFQTIEGYLMSKVRRAGIPTLDGKILEDLIIPVPPLPVQEEIVRILDTFTELQAELQAELQKRQQQYNFYRDNLLNFNRGGQEIKWMKLKDVCIKPNNIKWKYTTSQYRYIDLSSVDIRTHSIISAIKIDKTSAPSRAQQIVQENDVIFATTRPLQMRACIIPAAYSGDICSTGYCVLRADRNILLPKFLFFSMTTSTFKIYLSNNLTLGNYPSISNSALMGYEIPVPPIAEQQKIVSILDRFDTLTNDLTSGLPAEIEKRRQQYEYYRDRLLTFKRL